MVLPLSVCVCQSYRFCRSVGSFTDRVSGSTRLRRSGGVVLRRSDLRGLAPQPRPGVTVCTTASDTVAWESESEVLDEQTKRKMESLRDSFKLADTDGNGVIDRTELRDLLESTAGGLQKSQEHWISEEEVDSVFRRYDPRDQGHITFDAYCRLVEDGVLLDGQIDEYQAAFRAVDTGGNGRISATEVAQLFANLGTPLSYDKLVKVMAEYDVDRSGQIDFYEFLRMFRGELLDLKEIFDYMQAKESSANVVIETPKSGSSIMEGGTVSLVFSEAELDALLKSCGDRVVVLMATLTWCRPCKALAPAYEKLAAYYLDTQFVKLFGNSNESTKEMFKNRLKARVTPTFYFFKNGKLVHSHTGANKSRLEHFLRESLAAGRTRSLPRALFPPYVEGAAAQ